MTSKENSPSAPGFNPAQQKAIDHVDGPLLVVAGAGTGKTRVIVERIRTLLENDPTLTGENILGLTFTDKAAGEMKHRVVKAVGERAEGVWLSTFHKFCLEKILKTVRPDVQALEPIDHKILMRRNIAQLDLKQFRRLQEPGEFIGDFEQFFSRCQDELVSPDDYERYVAELRKNHDAVRSELEAGALEEAEHEVARQEELARVYRVSERLLREKNLLTFGAQLSESVAALRDDRELREKMRDQFKYILVDEFQDTNIAQLELLWLLAGERRNIVAVGDDDQAIYRFRGASFGSFTIFLKRFCEVTGNKKGPQAADFLVSLSQNYRSSQRILRVAGELISHNEKSPLLPKKNLITENRDGEKVRIAEFATAAEEAHWVASEIERLHEKGVAWRSFAVLYRKHTHRTDLLSALRRKDIPFVIKKFSILTSTLVKDMFAWLRFIEKRGDNVACARVLAAPYWGLEPKDLVRLAERAAKNKRSLGDEVEASKDEAPFNREGVRLGEMVSLLHTLRSSARRKSATDLVDELIAGLGLAPLPSDQDRYYLERFVTFVKEWQRKSDGKRLADFIEYLEYFYEAGGDIHLEEEMNDDAVNLMTVHAAKGLEFPHVFILRLTHRDFPSGTRKPVFEFPAEMMKEEQPQFDFQNQEERRLFYVALTRAKQRLTLSTVLNKRLKPSPFLEDFLMNAKIKQQDVHQFEAKVDLPLLAETTGPSADPLDSSQLFGASSESTRAYSQVAVWAKAFHPPRPEPLQLSSSAIDCYDRCPQKYMFQYSWSIPGGPHAMATFGNVMHTTVREMVEEIKKRGKVTLAEVEAIYDRHWSDSGYIDDYHAQEYRKAGRQQLEAFWKTYSMAPADVLYQEKKFELPLEHDVIVTGRIDQINRLDGKKVEIIDYKTGKPKDKKAAAKDLQLGIYALAAEEILELVPAKLVFYSLTSNETVESTRDSKALKETRETIAKVADQIRAREFTAKPGFGCKFCDYRPICPSHEQLISIRGAADAAILDE
jgi:DNA helicase II / ATP-dependent DNA helicase PcrA